MIFLDDVFTFVDFVLVEVTYYFVLEIGPEVLPEVTYYFVLETGPKSSFKCRPPL